MSRRPALSLPDTSSGSEQTALDVGQDTSPARPVAPRADDGVLTGLTGATVTASLTVEQLPEPYDVAPEVVSPLSTKERVDLDLCEQALNGFRKALIVAGKALEVINRGRLYRETHATFEDYVMETWGFKRAHAYRMIEEWPVAAACLRIGDINELQARELLPVWKTHGPEATVTLYREVRELAGENGKRRVSAADLAQARDVLPSRLAAPDQVADVLRVAAAEGRVPRIVPPKVTIPEQPAKEAPPVEADATVRTEADLRNEVNRELKACVADLTQALHRVERITELGVVANDLGAAINDASKARSLAHRIITGLTVPGAPGGQDEEA